MKDPYEILGVSPDASPDDIKRAYRKKTKECHPDLHPDDPDATKKMAEINEAYDMLINPGKYAGKQQNNKRETSGGSAGDNKRTYEQGPYGSGRNTGRYQGTGGWYSDFGGFDFEDFFGFGGFGQSDPIPDPQREPGDSPQIILAVDMIRNRQYQGAVEILNRIVSTQRNARWYYLSALANQGAGNNITALEQIKKAVQYAPDNAEYKKVLQQFQQAGRQYQDRSGAYGAGTVPLDKICLGCCAAQCLCQFC